jgi:hypothetical protein
MKRNIVLPTLGCLCLLVLTVYGRQPQTPSFVVWEYKQSCNLKESEMNKLGVEGWELVTSSYSGVAVACLFYKRQKQ